MINRETKTIEEFPRIVGFSLLGVVTIVGVTLFAFYVTLHYFKMREFDDRLACVHAAHVMNHNPEACYPAPLKGVVR